jgi:hypothetical protein
MSNTGHIRITHKPSGEIIAEGPLGWGIKAFEGSYYIQRRYLKTSGFKVNFIPGLCFYKFLYVRLDFSWPDGKSSSLGWLHWLPNPLFPFVWYRVAVPDDHPEFEYALQAKGPTRDSQ